MSRPPPVPDRDAGILDRIRRGDRDALVAVYRQCDGAVRRHVIANNGSQDDADDVLQEALVILWERARDGRLELTARLSTFVVGVAHNLWLRRLAHARRESPAREAVDGAPDPGESPLDTMVRSERAGAVHRALRTLGDPCRTLLLLFYWEQASMEEIAVRLGFANAGTAKARKYQCKKSLQQILSSYERQH
jgi:RNA polymerase sigma factor (sigma-70 family)